MNMSSNVKRGLLTAVAAMLIASLTACSGASNEGANGNKGEGASTAKPSESATPKAPAEFSLVMNGRGQYIESLNDINEDPFVNEMEKLSNTKLNIELILQKDFDQKMGLKMSSGEIPDVVNVEGADGIYSKALSGGVQAGVFMELDELLNEYGTTLLKKIPAEAWDRVKYKGKIVGIPAWKSIPNELATYIRKDFMEKAGITEAPKTVDEYLDMLRAFKKAGVEYPMLAQDKFSLSDQFFAAYDVLPLQFELIDGKVVPKFMKADAMMEALTVYKTLLDEGLISKEFTTNTGNNLAQNVYSNKHGMFMLGAASLNSVNAKLKNLNNGEGEFIQALAPVGPDGKGGGAIGSPVHSVSLINSKVSKEKAADIIKFFEWQVSSEGEKFHTYGIAGQTYTEENGKVNYTLPTDPDGINRQEFHQNFLWWVNEKSYQPRELLDPAAVPVIDWMKNMLVQEGRGTITFSPPLDAQQKNPDLKGDSSFMMERILKIIYGQEPVSSWPKVIEDWKKRGGDQLIEEATKRYNEQDRVFMPIR